MGWETDIPDVVAGQPITSSWGNLIRNRVVHVVPTTAALPTAASGAAPGSVAYVLADGTLWVMHPSNKWWTRKMLTLSGKTTDASGLVVITAADVGLASITRGSAEAGHTTAVTAVAFSSSRVTTGSPVNIEMRVWKPAGAAPNQVTVAASQAISLGIEVIVEGYLT